MSHATLPDRLHHVYWLGGSPCSGKSTVAGLIHQRHGIDVYHVDDAVRFRFGPFDPLRQPCMHRWTESLGNGDVTWDDIWMRPVDELLDEVVQCYAEQFELVIAELLDSPPDRPLLVEGNPLMPDMLSPFLRNGSRALWMVPSEEFQRRAYPRRGAWVHDIVSNCRDPSTALQNWMDRDVEFAKLVAVQAIGAGRALVTVDGSRSIEENTRLVAERLGIHPHEKGPAL